MKKNILLLLVIACSPKQSTLINIVSLQGTWKLSSINEEMIDTANYPNGTPELTFDVVDRKVHGYTGCNRASGNFTLEKESSLTFQPLISTKMFCPGNGETQFLEVLQTVTRYKINSDKLILLSDSKQVLELTTVK